jgi:GNAT superfamily N-acetyltransferase
MIIREATLQDAPALARMRWDFTAEDDFIHPNATHEEYERHFTQFLDMAISSGRWSIWVVEDAGQLVSHIFMQVIEKVPRPGRQERRFGWVTNVYTIPEYRNRGVGSQLMAQVEAWSKAQNLELMLVWPTQQSVPYYQRAGFEYAIQVLQNPLDDY